MAVLRRRPSPLERCASAASAITPPSPLLSARMMKATYLTVTTISSVQKISDMAPNTAAADGMPLPSAAMESFIA